MASRVAGREEDEERRRAELRRGEVAGRVAEAWAGSGEVRTGWAVGLAAVREAVVL